MYEVAPENVFVSIQAQSGGYRVFLARGGDRCISPASPDELAWLNQRFPWIDTMCLAGEHKPEDA